MGSSASVWRPSQGQEETPGGDSLAGPMRFVDFGGNRHCKISLLESSGATEASRRPTGIGSITVDVKVNLPDASLAVYGYSTSMKLDEVLARIESRLTAVGLSAHAASVAAKRPDAIRNLKRAVKNRDRRGITTETLMALAPVLKTTAAWLLEGVGDPAFGNLVRVVGRIGAGAEIQPEFEQISPESWYEIEVPFPVSTDAVAFQVEGDSMWPRYDPGDVIICWRQGTNVEEVIGWEAAVRTADGKRYLKRIQRGAASGTFDLESHNAAPMRGVRIEWAAEIKGVVRSGQWHRK
jgi:hypothetical protein